MGTSRTYYNQPLRNFSSARGAAWPDNIVLERFHTANAVQKEEKNAQIWTTLSRAHVFAAKVEDMAIQMVDPVNTVPRSDNVRNAHIVAARKSVHSLSVAALIVHQFVADGMSIASNSNVVQYSRCLHGRHPRFEEPQLLI